MDLGVAEGLDDRLAVRAVRLVATHIGAHVVWGQKHHSMAAPLQLASPVVGGAAGFHDYSGSRVRNEERQELIANGPLTPAHVTWPIRNRYLKDSLCNIDRDDGIVLHDGLLLCLDSNDFGTSMPIKSWRSPSHQ